MRSTLACCEAEPFGLGCVLAHPVFERIAHPSVTAEWAESLQPSGSASLGSNALAGALSDTVRAVTGITTTSLRVVDDRTAPHDLRHRPGQLRSGAIAPHTA